MPRIQLKNLAPFHLYRGKGDYAHDYIYLGDVFVAKVNTENPYRYDEPSIYYLQRAIKLRLFLVAGGYDKSKEEIQDNFTRIQNRESLETKDVSFYHAPLTFAVPATINLYTDLGSLNSTKNPEFYLIAAREQSKKLQKYLIPREPEDWERRRSHYWDATYQQKEMMYPSADTILDYIYTATCSLTKEGATKCMEAEIPFLTEQAKLKLFKK